MANNMVLKRFTCDEPCKQVSTCGHLPMELVRFTPRKPLDILFVTEFPGKSEFSAKRFLDNETRHGAPFRTIIKLLEQQYGTDWSYGISGLFKGIVVSEEVKDVNNAGGSNNKKKSKKSKKEKRRLTLDVASLQHCAEQTFKREIQYANPRVLVLFGEYAFNYIFGTKDVPFGIMVENGKLYKNVEIFGEKRDVFVSIHPSWHVRQADACAVGALYEVIRRAIDYRLNGIDLSIPDKFKTKVLTDYDDVKHVLLKMRSTPSNIAVDTEDLNLNKVYGNEILSLQLSNNGKTGYVIPLDHYESPFKGDSKIKKLLYQFFTKPNNKSTGYLFVNAKYDMHQIFHYCHALEYNAPLLDCSFAEYSLDENWTRLHGFPMGKGHFSLFTMSYKRGFNYYAESEMKESRAYLAHLPLDKWAVYGGADVVAPWNIFNSQRLQAERTGYLDNFIKLNYIFFGHLIRACTYVEHCGLSINIKILDYLHSPEGPFDEAYQEIMDGFFACESVKRVNEQLIKESTGHTSNGLFGVSRLFKPSRYSHTERLYFEELRLETVEDDDDEENTGGTIGKAFQKQYRDTYPEVALLEQYNALNKMKTGFVNPVYNWMSKKSKDKREDFYTDDRVRSNFTYMAVTGRLKASDPNCQSLDSKVIIDGQEISFKELIERDNLRNGDDVSYNILTPTGYRKAYKFWFYKDQPIFKITTENNLVMKCTYHNDCLRYHPLTDKIEKLKAEQLSVGDYFICNQLPKDDELYSGTKTRFGGLAVRITNIEKAGNADVADFTVERDYKQENPLHYGSIIVNNLWSFQSQQRPSRGKHTKTILSMYAPKKGRALVKLDYVTFEVKGLGLISKDEAMIKSFNEMHELKNQFRENPYIFYEQGREVEKKVLLKKREELLDRKAKLPALQEISPKDFAEAQQKLTEDIKAFKEEKEKFKRECKENKVKFSLDYLKFQTDFHRRSAALFNKISVEEVKKEMRQNAKSLVFGSFEGSTIISTSKGPYRIQNIIDKDSIKVQSVNCSIKESDGGKYKGIEPIVTILTRRSIINASSGHHVMVVTPTCQLEMKPCGLLKKGEKIIVQRGILGNHIPRLMGKKISLEDAEALGAYTGDGTSTNPEKENIIHYRVGYTAVEKEEVQRFKDFVDRWTGKDVKIAHLPAGTRIFPTGYTSITQPIYKIDINNKKLWEGLRDFGLLGRQSVRRVPDQILRAKPEYICAYLRGYFDADGGMQKTSIARNRHHIFLVSMHDKLIYEVAYLLNMLGITSNIYKITREDSTFFNLIITNLKSAIVFYEKIGFGTKRKQKVLHDYITFMKNRVTRKLAIDKVQYPFSHASLLKTYQERAGVNTFRSRPVYVNGVRILPLRHKPIEDTIKHIDEYKESFYALGMKSEWKCLKLLSNPNVMLSEVYEEAVDIGEHPVYDIVNVEKYHKYTANGAIVSNSIYGRSVESIAKELKIEKTIAQSYFDAFMNNMPQAGQWLTNQAIIGKQNLSVESPLGRRRRVWGYILNNKSVHSKMDRLCQNSTIQGLCSDCNLIATSLLMTLIHHHERMWYQTDQELCWMLTNLVHDSCEMELPLVDVYYALKTFETLYTDLLMYYIEKAFGFKILVPLEVDFTVGSTYANTQDWDGSDEHARYLQKWVLEECGKRDNCDYSDLYENAINHPYFHQYKGLAKRVVKEWISIAEKTYDTQNS